MVEILFLGTSSANFSKYRAFTSFLIRLPTEEILVDCGSWRICSHINLTRLSKIFISHHHQDHILFLGPLIGRLFHHRRERSLQIYCLKGIRRLLEWIIRLSTPFILPKFIEFIELDIRDVGVVFKTEYLVLGGRANHFAPTLCYAFKFNNQKVTFACDTRANYPHILNLAKNSAYLIHESCLPNSHPKQYSRRYHSTPVGAGLDARLSNSTHLIITHFSDWRFKNKTQMVYEIRREFKKRITIATDLLKIKI